MKKFLLLFTAVILIGVTGSAFADDAVVTLTNPLCPVVGGANCISNFPSLLTAISGAIMNIVGILATIVILWAGILFVTSGGNQAQIGKAKQALLYAVIGIGIVLAGNGLILVIKAVLGVA